MNTRLATHRDLDAIVELLGQLTGDATPPPPARARETFAAMLTNPAIDVFVADSGGRPIATCVLATIPNLTRACRPYALIENVIVDREHRDAGAGRQLIEHVLEHAWRGGCYKVMLLCNNAQPNAQDFYRACGFRSDEKQGFVIRHP